MTSKVFSTTKIADYKWKVEAFFVTGPTVVIFRQHKVTDYTDATGVPSQGGGMPQNNSTSSAIPPKAALKEDECLIAKQALKQQPRVIEEVGS